MTGPFTEADTVRDFVRTQAVNAGMSFIPGKDLARKVGDVLLASSVRSALVRLNPHLTGAMLAVDQVLLELTQLIEETDRGPLMSRNEAFYKWAAGEQTMPLGADGEHVTVQIFDDETPHADEWIFATEVSFDRDGMRNRFDMVVFRNGFPVVVGEAKRADKPDISWMEGASQLIRYQAESMPFFVTNYFLFATEAREFRYGSIKMPLEKWVPFRDEDFKGTVIETVGHAARTLLEPSTTALFGSSYTLFSTDKKYRRIKVIARSQQFQGSERMIARVLKGLVKQGLIWHFQGSGKSLLMVFFARRLRQIVSATIFVVLDRVDLESQIYDTFTRAGVKNVMKASNSSKLSQYVSTAERRVIITTVHKFAEMRTTAPAGATIVVLADEAHRTQEGTLATDMRQAVNEAFFFGLSGTPIATNDHNTFKMFGHPNDKGHYLSKYSFDDSIRDRATLPLHFEPRSLKIDIDQDAIDKGFEQLANAAGLSESEKIAVTGEAARLAMVLKSNKYVQALAADIAEHYTSKVEPKNLKAQVVVLDKQMCVDVKAALDQHLPAEMSTVVMSLDHNDARAWRDAYERSRAEEEALLDRFRDPSDPLKILVVTAKLLTGFDAPVLGVQYLTKPIQGHTLLQAICRANRTHTGKDYGLIVDYLGAFDDVAKALAWDSDEVDRLISDLSALRAAFPTQLGKTLDYFIGVDRSVGGWQGMNAAQQAISDPFKQTEFIAQFQVVQRLWEALSPDKELIVHREDYAWLASVYNAVRPHSVSGKLAWQALGPKTVTLINDNIEVRPVRIDLDEIILDPDLVAEMISGDPKGRAKEIAELITLRIASHVDEPEFISLGKRLEDLRERYERGQQDSLDFVRELIGLASDTLEAEKTVAERSPEERVKEALTDLFTPLIDKDTPLLVKKLVDDIDQVAKRVRYDGWKSDDSGDKEVKAALRRLIWMDYGIKDKAVFAEAYKYVRKYY